MAFFGGGGVQGNLHPSLRAYIDCFHSAPFPKRFPRDGGVWDQDPILMRDFRIIRAEEVRWKETQEQIDNAKNELSNPGQRGGVGGGLGSALEDYVNELEGE